MSMRNRAGRNRPAIASAVTGVTVALGSWGIDVLPASVPDSVTGELHAAVVVAAGCVGAIAGRWAQRHPFSAQNPPERSA